MSREHSIVIRYDNPDARSARDIVYLHGRGSSEREGGWLVNLLGKSDIRAYRGPLSEGGGFAWYRICGIGTADRESVEREAVKVEDWIDADSGARPVWLCGFSNGAAMASELMLRRPARYAGLIMIGGCFATDMLEAGRLADKPVLFCRGSNDTVIPRQKFDAAAAYLTGTSEARATLVEFDGAHEIPLHQKAVFRDWLAVSS